ncbi:hypothetical protein HK104_005990 [Borealophlyctis nickersoniae]|nr:hypothetical protein HK104_005990 [Borealophlyctis nickersoniae]
MHQALIYLEKQFPGLELSPVYDANRPDEYSYQEEGLFSRFFPTAAVAEVPLFEKLREEEEARLGAAGIRKKPVAKAVLKGSCKVGCAAVELTEIKVLKLNGDVVWEWKK